MKDINNDPYAFLIEEINKSIPTKFKHISELAEKAQVDQGNLSKLIKGQRTKLYFDTAYKVLQTLGIFLEERNNSHTIQRMGEHSPVEIVEGDNLVRVPVCAFSGAGNAVLYDDLEALHDIFIPSSYAYNDMKTLQILGDSMNPTIKDGAYIGVIKETELHIGKIYLVYQPPFGYVTKRIYQNENREIVLRSDNKEYVDITVPYEGYNDIIVGRVVWVLQHI